MEFWLDVSYILGAGSDLDEAHVIDLVGGGLLRNLQVGGSGTESLLSNRRPWCRHHCGDWLFNLFIGADMAWKDCGDGVLLVCCGVGLFGGVGMAEGLGEAAWRFEAVGSMLVDCR